MNETKINYEYYKVFYHTARLGSITLAAKELFLSQPAVSKSISRLEAILDCRLFSRSQHGVRLTPEGRVLYQHVSQACEQFDVGERKLTEMLTLENGEVRIAATNTVLNFYLLPCLERFHDRFPGIRLNVTQYSTPDAVEMLRTGQVDLAIVNSPTEEYSDVTAKSLGVIQDIFLCGSRHRKLTERPLTLEELVEHPIICLAPGTCTWDYLEQFFQSRGIELKPSFQLMTNSLVVSFVERSLGLGIAVEPFAKPAIQAGTVFPLTVKDPIPGRKICMITPSRNPLSHAAREFIDFMS